MLIQASILLVSVLLVLLNTLVFVDYNPDFAGTASLSVLPVMLLTSANLALRIRDPFHPSAILSYLIFLSVTLKVFFLVYLDSDDWYRSLSLGVYGLQVLADGLYLMTFAVLAWIAGLFSMFVFGELAKPRHAYRMTSASSRKLIAIVLLVGSVATLYFLYVSGGLADIARGKIFAKRLAVSNDGTVIVASYNYLRMLGQTLPHVALLAVVAAMWARQEDHRVKPRRILFYALVLLCLALPLLASARLELAYLLIFVVMLVHYLRRRINSIVLGAMGMIILIFLAILGEVRKPADAIDKQKVGIIAIAANTIARPYFMDIGKTSAIVAAVPEKVDYLNGQNFLNILVAPIPRSLWPGKPILATNIFVRDEILERKQQGGIPPGAVGEFYMNFGTPGVVFGIFLLSITMTFAYARMIQVAEAGSVTVVVYVIFMIVTMMTLMTVELMNYVSASFRYYIMFFVCVLPFLERKRIG